MRTLYVCVARAGLKRYTDGASILFVRLPGGADENCDSFSLAPARHDPPSGTACQLYDGYLWGFSGAINAP